MYDVIMRCAHGDGLLVDCLILLSFYLCKEISHATIHLCKHGSTFLYLTRASVLRSVGIGVVQR